MTETPKPTAKPANPCFSSGPATKRPGWTVGALKDACIGRSHRAKPGKAKLKAVIDQTRDVLGIPDHYLVGIVPASDTGAVEMALWSLLGARGVDLLAWESFGFAWATDVVEQLKLRNVRTLKADYGEIVDLGAVDFNNDVVFAYNGTTSGVRVPGGDWIPGDRGGLVIADATSAVFAMDMPWPKLDVATWSWQKVMGGEAAHGMMALSPRAVERLESHAPPWPLPKIFRLVRDGELIAGIFEGETINTPSMLAVEDALDGLNWARSLGGVPALVKRSEDNLSAIANWVEASDWAAFLTVDPATRSHLRLPENYRPLVRRLGRKRPGGSGKNHRLVGRGRRRAQHRRPPRRASGSRIWASATIERSDLELLFPWLDWAFAQARPEPKNDENRARPDRAIVSINPASSTRNEKLGVAKSGFE